MGRTKDGGSVVGASVFYADSTSATDHNAPATEVDKLDQVGDLSQALVSFFDDTFFSFHLIFIFIRGTVVSRWTAGLQVERSILHQGHES